MISKVAVHAYTWQGREYEHRKYTTFERGSIEVFSNNDEVCSSGIIIPGTELLDYPLLGTFYFLGMAYLFLGIAIIAEIFMGAIEVITSQTRKIKYQDEKSDE